VFSFLMRNIADFTAYQATILQSSDSCCTSEDIKSQFQCTLICW